MARGDGRRPRPARRGSSIRAAACMACLWLCAAGGVASAGTSLWNPWPASYPRINPAVTADGIITYQIDLSGMNLLSGRLRTPARIAQMSDAVRQAFAVWNAVLEPIGLRFAEAAAGQGVELAVRALPYDRFNPGVSHDDSIAVALGLPFGGIYTVLPIWFDSTEDLGALADEPLVADHLLSQPYIKVVSSTRYDIHTIALHEIGHTLGLAHVAEAVRTGTNYNFLGLSSVLQDAACLQPSRWVGGLAAAVRRPILETELPTVMIPIRRGTVATQIPPEDQATVAFLLRHLNPDGADRVLRQAQALYRQTTPLRFANVLYETERNNGYQRNGSRESAMPVLPNQIVVGSLFGKDSLNRPHDTDYYRLDLRSWPAATPLVLTIAEAGGLLDTGAENVLLQLLDEAGGVAAVGQPVGIPGPDNYSPYDPTISWSLATPGVHYIVVSQPDDAMPGMYVLKIGVGGPIEPVGQVTPRIDTHGSADCPIARLPASAGICPAAGLTAFLSIVALGCAGRRP